MTADHSELNESKFRRIRRVKWWLRPLPRRATIHRYPVLKFFSKAARKRVYLWSFRVENAVPAIYAGCILTLMPIYGIQIPLSFLLAVLLRANLPILAGLQVISNPITVIPIWFAAYQIGRHFLSVLGVDVMRLDRDQVQMMLDNFTHGNWGDNLQPFAVVFGVTNLGAIIMGVFFGLIASFTYRIVAIRTAASYKLILDKIHAHNANKANAGVSKQTDNNA
ncbi:MAG: DUF2062 domain-containing protein [Opitutaceae bacterium]